MMMTIRLATDVGKSFGLKIPGFDKAVIGCLSTIILLAYMTMTTT